MIAALIFVKGVLLVIGIYAAVVGFVGLTRMIVAELLDRETFGTNARVQVHISAIFLGVGIGFIVDSVQIP